MISLFNLVLMASCLAVTHGMKCYIGEDTFVNQLTHLSCPRPLLDDSAKSYCCIDGNGEFYCCNLFEFAMIYIIIAVVVVVVLSIVCSIICCFCCPCCFFYKRRHAGRPSRMNCQNSSCAARLVRHDGRQFSREKRDIPGQSEPNNTAYWVSYSLGVGDDNVSSSEDPI